MIVASVFVLMATTVALGMAASGDGMQDFAGYDLTVGILMLVLGGAGLLIARGIRAARSWGGTAAAAWIIAVLSCGFLFFLFITLTLHPEVSS